jgi:hypothetical protein
MLSDTEDYVNNSSRYTGTCRGPEGEEWNYEYIRVSGRSWKGYQCKCEDIGESVIEIEIIRMKDLH